MPTYIHSEFPLISSNYKLQVLMIRKLQLNAISVSYGVWFNFSESIYICLTFIKEEINGLFQTKNTALVYWTTYYICADKAIKQMSFSCNFSLPTWAKTNGRLSFIYCLQTVHFSNELISPFLSLMIIHHLKDLFHPTCLHLMEFSLCWNSCSCF